MLHTIHITKNNTHEIYSMLQGFDNMFHVIYAHEWMNNAHVHEMQVQLCKHNTRGVTKKLYSIYFGRGLLSNLVNEYGTIVISSFLKLVV